jgi:hypothetical protein
MLVRTLRYFWQFLETFDKIAIRDRYSTYYTGVSLILTRYLWVSLPSPVESPSEGFAWNKFMLEIITNRAAQENAVYSALELSTADATRTAI